MVGTQLHVRFKCARRLSRLCEAPAELKSINSPCGGMLRGRSLGNADREG